MAEAAVSALSVSLLAKFLLRAGIDNVIISLSREMKMIEDVLREAAEVSWCQVDPQIKIWAEEVRELSYDMELVVDKFVRTPSSEGLMEKMGSLIKKGNTRHQIISRAIKPIKARIRLLAEAGRRCGFFDIVDNPATIDGDNGTIELYHLLAFRKRGEDLVHIDQGKVKELMKLVLSDGDDVSNKKLKMASVVGFAGLGKTTLVKSVYDKIQMDFDCKAFVVAGRNPNLKKVLRDIISQLTMNNSYSNTCTLDEQELIRKIQEILEGKRYLVVIDDIWNENLWGNIKSAFSNKNNHCSRLITTTRIASVSKACCSSSNGLIYQMEPLSDDDSKKLLYDRIFDSVSECTHEFEQVSSDILKKCGGVPLAIIAMASVLDGDLLMKTKDEWHVLLKSIGCASIENSSWKEMQRILSFSYIHLLPRLKTCLLYLSIFPVGTPIERDRLVKKWIIEGIVDSQKLSPKEAASQSLDELVNNNVIQPLEYNSNGAVITYLIHPIMHDVLKSIAKAENFAALLDDEDISSAHRMNFRNFSIDCPDSENLINLSSMAVDGGVRSLTVFGHANQFLLRHFKGTRVLDLEGCLSIERADVEYICSMDLLKQLCLAKTDITELPPQIGNLQYLEGLDVGGTQITQLPPEIGKLQHLKTLDARKSGVKDLPDEVVQLTSLVYLLIGDNESCEGVKLPDGIGKMTSLEQLGTIDLRKYSASSLKELVELPYLKEIAVLLSNEPEDTRMNDDLLSSLSSTGLRSLVVCNDFRSSTLQSSSTYNLILKKLTVVRRSLKVPIGITAHHFLRKLDIKVCRLEEDDLNILREMPRLQSLIVRLEVLPTKMIHISCEGFPDLESFYVDCRMPRVTFEEGAMPKLEHLELKLYGGSASEEHMDIKHLLSLQKVTLRYSKWHATNNGIKETTEAVKTGCKEHQNEITLCIAEEHKDGTCTMETEVFQENRVASSSKMTEIGKEDGRGTGYLLDSDGTQEGGHHPSIHDIANASCSGTKEIEEVAE